MTLLPFSSHSSGQFRLSPLALFLLVLASTYMYLAKSPDDRGTGSPKVSFETLAAYARTPSVFAYRPNHSSVPGEPSEQSPH
ncbi:hypothetical protein N657DRAFT_642842 [Parathielavia appendiculata]|uniref:Uncharacterized protein n=1 Tax=Parathielavia appendiculata TaxID=2587402 RepID=A0AAN6U430_9PEZI|nr:hypothetical protein N657DRAFT_642842 [Parathielavia appendiculata]